MIQYLNPAYDRLSMVRRNLNLWSQEEHTQYQYTGTMDSLRFLYNGLLNLMGCRRYTDNQSRDGASFQETKDLY